MQECTMRPAVLTYHPIIFFKNLFSTTMHEKIESMYQNEPHRELDLKKKFLNKHIMTGEYDLNLQGDPVSESLKLISYWIQLTVSQSGNSMSISIRCHFLSDVASKCKYIQIELLTATPSVRSISAIQDLPMPLSLPNLPRFQMNTCCVDV